MSTTASVLRDPIPQPADLPIHRIRHPRNDAPGGAPRGHQPGAGLSRIFPRPPILKSAAAEAIDADINQYAITWGAKPFRDAIAAKYQRTYGLDFDPEREVTVCCGATEGMIASLLAVLDPGDEVVLFEPFYENYGPDTQLCGATSRYVNAAGAGLDLRPGRTARRIHSAYQGDHSQLAQ